MNANVDLRLRIRLSFWVAGLVSACLLLLGLRAGAGVAQSAPASVCATAFDSPPLSQARSELTAVAFSAPNDGWAVGSYSDLASPTLFSLHWDGRAWSTVPMPSPGTRSTSLYAVTAIAKDDAWAVGSYDVGTDYPNLRTLTLHWDGKQWSHVTIPGLGDLGTLSGVSGASSRDVWAVGSFYSPVKASQQSIILHWDGTKWTPAQLPDLGSSDNTLTSTSSRASNDAWAVGYYYRGPQGTGMLFLHWDGTTWKQVAPPETARVARLDAVVATGSSSAWVMGFAVDTGGGIFASHWDGSAWRVVAVPNVESFSGFGSSIHLAALSDSDVWASATIYVANNQEKLLILHWDGSNWTQQEPSIEPDSPVANAIAASTSDSIWIAGSQRAPETGFVLPLILRLSYKPCPTPTPSATSTPLAPLPPPVPIPGSGSVTFPETGKTVSGLFLKYWQEHCGLAQQGYPISDVMGEVSDLDHRTYSVQYFERAVFEYHPENKAPYDVLLSQLGIFEYHKRYPNGASNERANQDPGTIDFPETGKHLGGAFHFYWLNHGGLMQQGYPISEEFTEISPVDRKPYTVQYFERAVFEYHPENRGTPYEVLLSLLGRFQYQAKYVSPPSPVTPSPTPLLIADNVRGGVASNSRYLFWVEDNGPIYSVRGYDTQQQRAFLVTDRPALKMSITADEQTVAWVEGDVMVSASIRGYDIQAHKELTLVADRGPEQISEGRITLVGDTLYYVASGNNTYGVLKRNWKTGQEQMLVEHGTGPAVSGDNLVYSVDAADCTPGGDHPPCTFNQDLYLRTSSRDHDILIAGVATENRFQDYNIAGDNVVWTSPDSASGGNLYLFSLKNTSSVPLTELSANHPLINGNRVAWVEKPVPGAADIWAIEIYDLATGRRANIGQFQSENYVATQALVGDGAIAYSVARKDFAPGGYLYLMNLPGQP